MPKLYTLYLGGRAHGCSFELQDVKFAVGKSLRSLYPTILDKWFGLKDKCHIPKDVVKTYLEFQNQL